PLSRFPFSSVRRSPPSRHEPPGTHSFSIGVKVEVLNTARDSEAFGWWPARVKEIRSNVA
ncbi:Hypothetical protein FKW44_003597, partial [Caligus rogercresseyi]